MPDFDLLVIGAGAAGLSVAAGAANSASGPRWSSATAWAAIA